MPAERDRGEDPGVPEAHDDDARTAHAEVLGRFFSFERVVGGLFLGGRGMNSDTRSTTRAYSGRRYRLRCSIIGMLTARNIATMAKVPTNTHHAPGQAARPNRPMENQMPHSPK